MMVKRMHRKLVGCKGKVLSNVGKVQLLSASLQGILVYLSLFKISSKFRDFIEKIQCNFLWMGMQEKKKLSLFSWGKVFMPKSQGGLYLRRIGHLNKALVMKVGSMIEKRSGP